jgi:phosphomannomutase
VDPSDLCRSARQWLEDDPDADDRAEVEHLLSSGDEAGLAARFAAPLRFGTAGIRGPMRAGPAGINTATVSRTSAGLARFLPPAARVVVGHDARHRSAALAQTCAGILAGAGCRVLLIGAAVPTPLLAFAVRHLATDAGVMITASHNPPADNGLKVYLGGSGSDCGAQIAPPTDRDIEDSIDAVASVRGLDLSEPTALPAEELIEAYLDALALDRDATAPNRTLRIAYTPLHGVGAGLVVAALSRAGFAAPRVVSEQAEPDPDFPTVPFPNPEVPGALDRLLALVRESGADLGLASDPDADRCGAVVGGRVLTGDEIGWLLADAVLRRRPGPVATSLVSSTMLPKLAAAAGVPCAVTRTGFKWLMQASDDLVFAYEEALGYAVAPTVVRDKDGISAAVLLAEVADALRAEGRTLLDRLDELAVAFGLHLTRGVPVRLPSSDAARARVRQLVGAPPDRLGSFPVRSTGPLRADGVELPPEDGLALQLDGGRVLIRPSGTEPTVKAYLELVREVTASSVASVRATGTVELDALEKAVRALLG